MKTLKENMFVKLKNGDIGIYGSFPGNTNFRSNSGYSNINKDNIKKFDDDYINILDSGDYVNGYKIIEIIKSEKIVRIVSCKKYLKFSEITDILSFEQFNNNKFIIGNME